MVHSEFNASEIEPVHVIQIWILPEAEDLEPTYQQVAFTPEEKRGQLRLLAAPASNREKAMTVIRQDARVYAGEFTASQTVNHSIHRDRYAWIQVVKGNVSLNGQLLSEGDAAAVNNEPQLTFAGMQPAGGEVLLFDLR